MTTVDALFERHGPRYRWIATMTVMVAAIASALSTTIVNVAIPPIMDEFDLSHVQAQWLSTGFLAAMTATMLLTDWVEKAFGHRAGMLGALGLFLAGSILGGLATDYSVLVLARVAQGAAAGVIQPLAMVIVFRVFPPEKRGGAMGVFGLGVVLAPAIGPWVGGVLVDMFDWRWVFHLCVPFGLAAAALALGGLPTRENDGRRPGFDWLGAALTCVFLFTLLNAFSSGRRLGWDSPPILAQFALAAALVVAFLWWERRAPRPMLDLRLFLHLPFAAASLISFILGAGLFGSTYLLPLFVQEVQGFTPTQSGMLLMPAGLAMAAVFPIAGRMADRLPVGLLIGVGVAAFAYANYLTSWAEVDTAFWTLAWWTILSRMALGLIFPALTTGSLNVLPRDMIGQGSGAINFLRQLGGAFGVNLLAVLHERRAAFYAETAPEAQAQTHAFHDGFMVVAVVFAIALAPTLVLHRSQRSSAARLA